MTTYVIQAFDAEHNWLDLDPRGEGYPTEIEGAREMLQFVAATKTGVLHNFDRETHETKRIAYWHICVGGVVREVFTTAWGRRCTRTMAALPNQGPGCYAPRPIPTI